MKVHKISIRNILGVEALEFEPGAITRITGGNGQGKTSVLEAIRAVCKGGYDATLLRNGQTKGEIVLELEDGLQVSKRVTEKGAYLAITKDGNPVSKPADFLGGLWDSLSANPVEFMTATKRKRIDWLLEQIDPEPVIEKLAAISPGLGDLSGSNALAAMDQARKTVYDARTEINRQEKQARETAEVLAQDLPEESGDVAAKLEAAKTEHATLSTGLADAVDGIREIAKNHEKSRADAEEAEVEALRSQIEAVRLKYQQAAESARESTDAEVSRVREETQPKIDAAAAEVSRLQEAQRTADEAEGRRKLLAKNREAAAEAKKRSQDLSDRIDRIDSLKKQVLESLPIPGVEVIDGDIHKDGVPFDRLNTATQWAVAIAIAKMRAGEIPLICADGLEALDDANFAAFSAMAADSGLHFIVTDRGNGPLAVDTAGSREAAA